MSHTICICSISHTVCIYSISHTVYICSISHTICICSMSHTVCICSISHTVCISSISHTVYICSISHTICICSMSHTICICSISYTICICTIPHTICLCTISHKIAYHLVVLCFVVFMLWVGMGICVCFSIFSSYTSLALGQFPQPSQVTLKDMGTMMWYNLYMLQLHYVFFKQGNINFITSGDCIIPTIKWLNFHAGLISNHHPSECRWCLECFPDTDHSKLICHILTYHILNVYWQPPYINFSSLLCFLFFFLCFLLSELHPSHTFKLMKYSKFQLIWA